MGNITDLNITGKVKGKFSSLLGDAHEYIATGIPIRLGFTVSVTAVKAGPYDLLVNAFERPGGREIVLRCQIKSSSRGSIPFTAGTRAGINRVYIPGVKKYKYTTEHNDFIIGVDVKALDFYPVPTRFLVHWGESRAFSKLQPLRNNRDIPLSWNTDYLNRLLQILVERRKSNA